MFDTISQLAAEWLLPGIFFWLVMCLAATNILEWLSTRVKIRAHLLETAIQNMLGDEELTRKFYNHVLLSTTRAKSQVPSKAQFTRYQRPDYINPRLFGQIILDWVANAGESTPSKRKSATQSQLRRNMQTLHLRYPQLAEVLEVLLLGCNEDNAKSGEIFSAFQTNLEGWFNAAMEETTRQYKQYVQRLLLVVGFILALYLNFDPVSLTIQLWDSSQSQQTTSENGDHVVSAPLLLGWKLSSGSESMVRDVNCQLFPGDGQSFGIPFMNSCISPPSRADRTNLLLKAGGILLGSLFISVGSQYVFDLWKNKITT